MYGFAVVVKCLLISTKKHWIKCINKNIHLGIKIWFIARKYRNYFS